MFRIQQCHIATGVMKCTIDIVLRVHSTTVSQSLKHTRADCSLVVAV